MRYLPLFLLLLLPASLRAQSISTGPYAYTMTQRNAAGTANLPLWWIHPPSSNQNGIQMIEGSTKLPRMAVPTAPIVFLGGAEGALTLDFTGVDLSTIGLDVPTWDELEIELAPVAWTGDYEDLINKPSGTTPVNADWNASSGLAQILNKPTLFSGDYDDLTDKPSLFSGAYADLTGKPTLFDGAYSSLTGVPSTFAPSAHTHVMGDVTGLTAALAAKFATPSGTTAQYVRGDGSLATTPVVPTNVSAFTNDAGYLTGVTSGQITTALGFTPYNATNPSGYVTTAGARSAVTLTTTGSGVATYNSGTGALNIPTPPAAVARSFNNAPGRSIVSVANAANGFQISSTRDSQASYSVTIQVNATGLIAGASSGYVVYEIAATNSATPGDWTEIGRWTNGQTFTSILTLSSAQPVGADITKLIPAGYYVRMRSVNISGAPTYTVNSGQEVLL